MSGTKLSWEGIELVSLVLGFIGSALGIAYMPKMDKAQLFAALLSGVVCAALGTPGFEFAYMNWSPAWINPGHEPMPEVLSHIVAFFLGVGGMFIIPGMILFWRNPVAFIQWLKGAKAPPAMQDSVVDLSGEEKVQK